MIAPVFALAGAMSASFLADYCVDADRRSYMLYCVSRIRRCADTLEADGNLAAVALDVQRTPLLQQPEGEFWYGRLDRCVARQ